MRTITLPAGFLAKLSKACRTELERVAQTFEHPAWDEERRMNNLVPGYHQQYSYVKPLSQLILGKRKYLYPGFNLIDSGMDERDSISEAYTSRSELAALRSSIAHIKKAIE